MLINLEYETLIAQNTYNRKIRHIKKIENIMSQVKSARNNMFLPNDIICAIQEKLEKETCPFYTRVDVGIDVNNFKQAIGLPYDILNISKIDDTRRLKLRDNNYDNAHMIQRYIMIHTRCCVPKELITQILPLSKEIPVDNIVIISKNKGIALEQQCDIDMDTFTFAQKYGTYECRQVETLKRLNYGNVGVSLRCRRDEEWNDGFMCRAEQIMNNTPNRSGWVHLFLLEGCVKFIISGHSHLSSSTDMGNMWELLSNISYMRGAIHEKAQAYECYGDYYDKYDDIMITSTHASLVDIDNEINQILLVRSLAYKNKK